MYFTIKYLAPKRYVPVIAWIDGRLPYFRFSLPHLCAVLFCCLFDMPPPAIASP